MGVKYLSPSSYMKYMKNKEEFFLQYMVPDELRPPRPPQTEQMAIGSIFDALVKTALSRPAIAGQEALAVAEAAFTLIKSQVEGISCWDDLLMHPAFKDGLRAYIRYRDCGALGRMALLFNGATGVELEGSGCVDVYYTGDKFSANGMRIPATAEDYFFRHVPDRKAELPDPSSVLSLPSGQTATFSCRLFGKPDVFFFKDGQPVILDWKVNSWRGKVSPNKGYIWSSTGKIHPKAMLGSALGVPCDISTPIGALKEDWNIQLAIYGWFFVDAPTRLLCGIDQLTGDGGAGCVTQYRNWLPVAAQLELLGSLIECWKRTGAGTGTDIDAARQYCAQHQLGYAELMARAKGLKDDPDGVLAEYRRDNAW